MLKTIQEQKESGDYAHLESKDDYALYFNLISVVLNKLLSWIKISGDSQTLVRDLKPIVDRLLFSVELMRVKYLYIPMHKLAVDLNDSGFPHSSGIFQMATDLKRKDEVLQGLPGANKLKDLLIDKLLSGDDSIDVSDILEELGTNTYFSQLEEGKLFLPFTPGKLERIKTKGGNTRSYLFTWATYGSNTNLPYLHSMVFEQDLHAEPLENGGENWEDFLKTIGFSSQHIPKVSVLSFQIDDGLNSIHPKLLQRVQVGPLFSPLCCFGNSGEEFCQLLEKFGQDDDFVLELCFETIVSKGSKESSSLFSLGEKKVRQIFFVPSSNIEAYERGADKVVRKLMLPHRVLQNVDREAEYFKPYRRHGKITYNKKGEIHVI